MTRPTRTLLILALMSVAGVGALAMMAQRYSRVLERRGQAGSGTRIERPVAAEQAVGDSAVASDPQRYVVGFLTVRRALQGPIGALAAARGERERAAALSKVLAAREVALEKANLDPADYVAIRSVYRLWRSTPDAVSPSFRAAFLRNLSAIEAANLGHGELLDP